MAVALGYADANPTYARIRVLGVLSVNQGAAQLLLESENAYLDISVYHCQQAAEKAIKAYLVYQAIEFPKTHNLVALLAICLTVESQFGEWRQMGTTLNPYATAYRYPGETLEPERAEAEQALEMATAFVNFVLQVLPTKLEL